MRSPTPPVPNPQALRPFDPRRLPFYYGWVVAVVGTVGMLASVPGQTNGVSVFTDHLIAATGLGRTDLANAYLFGTLGSALLLPRGGRWIDRFGCRVVAFGATAGLATSLVALSFVGRTGFVAGMAVMTAGFAAIRFTGQGLLTLSSRTMVAQWFDRRRGRVTSVSSASFSFVFSLTPTLLYLLIDRFGFRGAWRLCAVLLVAVVGGLVLVLYRHRPEDCGLWIDGRAPGESHRIDGRGAAVAPIEATRAEALRTRQFWIITIPVVCMAVVSTALTFHIVDLGREMGIDERSVVRLFVPVALVSIPVTLVTGWLSDVVPVTRIALGMSAAQVVMYLTVSRLDVSVLRPFALIAWGASAGCFAVLTSAALPRLFGRTHLGSIAGFQMSAMVLGSAVGPAFFALVEASVGTYRVPLLLSVLGPAGGLILGLLPDRASEPPAPD